MSMCLVLYCSNSGYFRADVCLGTCGSGLQEKKTRMCKLIELVTVEIRALVQSEVLWRNGKHYMAICVLGYAHITCLRENPKLATVSIHALLVTNGPCLTLLGSMFQASKGTENIDSPSTPQLPKSFSDPAAYVISEIPEGPKSPAITTDLAEVLTIETTASDIL